MICNVDKLKVDDVEKILESLRWHSIQMRNLMDDPNKIANRNYLSLAMHLRTLLCDSDNPILIVLARYVGLTLPIVGGFGDLLEEMPEGLVVAYDFMGCHWDLTGKCVPIPIEKFLTSPIGVDQAYDEDGKPIGKPYNPTEIIKWVANKDGAAHLDFKEPKIYKSVKGLTFHSKGIDNKNIISQRLIYQLTRWTIIAITYVLELSGLEEVIFKELEKLKDVKRIDVTSLNREMHLMPYREGTKYFEGEHFIKSNVQIDITSGFQLHAMINITTQLNKGEMTIFEASLGSDNMSKITVCISNKDLLFKALLSTDILIVNQIEGFTDTEYFSHYMHLAYELKELDDKVKSEVWINGKLVSSREIDGSIKGVLSKVVFSGTVEEKNSATFFMRECMILSGTITDEERLKIEKYLWCNFIKEEHLESFLSAVPSLAEAQRKTNKDN